MEGVVTGVDEVVSGLTGENEGRKEAESLEIGNESGNNLFIRIE